MIVDSIYTVGIWCKPKVDDTYRKVMVEDIRFGRNKSVYTNFTVLITKLP